jgi:hypothetical protein
VLSSIPILLLECLQWRVVLRMVSGTYTCSIDEMFVLNTNHRNYAENPITPTHVENFKYPRLYSIQWRSKEKHLINVTQVAFCTYVTF